MVSNKTNTCARHSGSTSSFFAMESQQKFDCEAMLSNYLNLSDVSKTIDNLKIRKLFIKYNTSIPSSAPVERLFSTAKRCLTDLRCNLSDENFEMQLILSANDFL